MSNNSQNPPAHGDFATAWQMHEPDPNCKCNKPLAVSLKPGQRYYPCEEHPDFYIEGKRTTFLD